jgi:hypothetical protein
MKKLTQLLVFGLMLCFATVARGSDPASDFLNPPDSARPWVYCMIMDGNLTREGITADLESMKRVGIGGAILLEVNVGVPRGPVEFMSREWQELFAHAVHEADRLGLQIAVGTGPGWCGTGGPWVKPEQSMQHLVSSVTTVRGPMRFAGSLPRPQPRQPFFGIDTLTPELAKAWREFYADVAVVAFPTPQGDARVADIDEKALYHRAPFSSAAGVKAFLPEPDATVKAPTEQCIAIGQIIDLTSRLSAGGRLEWEVPTGEWTIVRFGRTSTGQSTRPAPLPGLGFESDKFDPAAIAAHFDAFTAKLIQAIGPRSASGNGLTTIHFDSWEMSSQNWSKNFRTEFKKRRGYDPLPYLPIMTGRIVQSLETSERFLWDLRQTAQELVVANHVGQLKELGRRHGLQFSIEPYDMNPTADLNLGSVADVPMCEFWSKGHGFSTEYSCLEAVSIGHTGGAKIIAAESFTAADSDTWLQYPTLMKAQTDWALATGINRLVFHRYQHQPSLDQFPGMTMGPYGVHWERTETWWDMVPAYHEYLARCQQMLRRGLPVADILYLTPEGAPHVFRPPTTATTGNPPDRRGYNFDGVSPEVFLKTATVENGRIAFPGGMTYRVLVLPQCETMTPPLAKKVKGLIEAGASVIGTPPRRSPSLADYPHCDEEVKRLAAEIWGTAAETLRRVGAGTVIRQQEASMPSLPTEALKRAHWIWYPEGNPAATAPVGTRFFSRAFKIDRQRTIESARIYATADNSFHLLINGNEVLEGNNFHETYHADLTGALNPGENRLFVVAENGGDAPNPAGLLGLLVIRYTDGCWLTIATDKSWQASANGSGRTSPAMELGPASMAPWNWQPSHPPGELYPAYATVATALAAMGTQPDFQSDAPLRYTHRHDGEDEIYFVANRSDRPQSALCQFRVVGKWPERWDSVTGRRYHVPVVRWSTQQGGRTGLHLEFAPYQSAFIVFHKVKPTSSLPPRLERQARPVADLAGPWRVSFDPAWGGPAEITFEKLMDWTTRPEEGIRHYSGKAVYRKRFDLSAESRRRAKGGCCLALGVVHDMASVKLNGRNLGVVWCDPWEIEFPAESLRELGNELEICIANRWPNRMIGDQALPQDRRRTKTTWNPFQKSSPLLPSGLIGPVQVLATE